MTRTHSTGVSGTFKCGREVGDRTCRLDAGHMSSCRAWDVNDVFSIEDVCLGPEDACLGPMPVRPSPYAPGGVFAELRPSEIKPMGVPGWEDVDWDAFERSCFKRLDLFERMKLEAKIAVLQDKCNSYSQSIAVLIGFAILGPILTATLAAWVWMP